MKLNCGQLILTLSAFPPKTKVRILDDCVPIDDIEVKEYEFANEVVILIGQTGEL